MQDITELMSSEVGAVTEELVDVPDFLNDFTMINITDEDCVGVQVDPLDFQNVSLVVVDCSSISLVFCEVQPDYESVSNSSNLPGLPCVPTSTRQKRSINSDQGNFDQ